MFELRINFNDNEVLFRYELTEKREEECAPPTSCGFIFPPPILVSGHHAYLITVVIARLGGTQSVACDVERSVQVQRGCSREVGVGGAAVAETCTT